MRGLGRLTAEKASVLKALRERKWPQDVSAWLVAVNGGRANDVEHGRRYADLAPASLNEVKARLLEDLRLYEALIASL